MKMIFKRNTCNRVAKRAAISSLVFLSLLMILNWMESDFSPVTRAVFYASEWLLKDPSYSPELMDRIEKLSRSMTLTQMKFGSAHILGAVVANSSQNTSWDVIRLFASMDASLRDVNVSCCFKFTWPHKQEYFKIPVSIESRPLKRAKQTAFLYACQNNRPGIIPDGVGITVGNLTCAESHVSYIPPYVPQVQKSGTTLALCNKGVFGTIKAEIIIEWMETYRYLGVDKVVTYFFKGLNENALKVLLYYSAIGFVDLFNFHPVIEDTLHRSFSVKDLQSMNDRQLTVFDSFERMSGYTYFGVIDHDEFLIPSRNRTLKQLMADLYKAYPDAAGFTFKMQSFFLSWGAEYGIENDLIIGRHITRTTIPPGYKGRKNIYKPKYIQTGGAHTHKPVPIEGKYMVLVPDAEGYICHFRNSFYNDENAFLSRVPTKDTWVSTWSNRIQNNVLEVRKRIFGSTNPIP